MQNYIHIVKDETFTKKEMIHITIKNKKLHYLDLKLNLTSSFYLKLKITLGSHFLSLKSLKSLNGMYQKSNFEEVHLLSQALTFMPAGYFQYIPK